jgi:hypothetical protein
MAQGNVDGLIGNRGVQYIGKDQVGFIEYTQSTEILV